MVSFHRPKAFTVLACVMTAVAGASVAQQPPPPPAIISMPDNDDRSKPHLLNDRLDYSFCDYPVEGLRTRIEGCCRMKVEITASGRAGRMTGECTHDMFMAPSKACLAPQSYLPALKKGKAAAGTGDIVVNYVLSKNPSLIDMIGNLFRKPAPENEPEICEPRPGDLISGLSASRG